MKSITLDSESLYVKLVSMGLDPDGISIRDSIYAPWTSDFIEGEFSQALGPFMRETVGPYVAEEADCDDFADAAAFYARLTHRRSPDRPLRTAVLFGEFYYRQRSGIKHAINPYLTLVENRWMLGFYEPQLLRTISLSPDEIRSCTNHDCRF